MTATTNNRSIYDSPVWQITKCWLVVSIFLLLCSLCVSALENPQTLVLNSTNLYSEVESADKFDNLRRHLLTLIGEPASRFEGNRASKQLMKPITVPSYLWDIYSNFQLPNALTNHYPTKDLPIATSSSIRSYFPLNASFSQLASELFLTFNVSHWPTVEKLLDADVRLVISIGDVNNSNSQPWHDANNNQMRINVYEVIDRAQNIRRLLDTHLYNFNTKDNATTISPSLNVKPAVESALLQYHIRQQAVINLTVQFSISTNHSAPSPLLSRDAVQQPMLLLYSTDEKNWQNRAKRHKSAVREPQPHHRSNSRAHRARHRAKRPNTAKRSGWSAKHLRSNNESSCRRHAVYVDFKRLQWNDWVLAPPGYHAYFCSGQCSWPYVNAQNTTNHAIVQSLVYSVSRAAPQPCCVPTDLSPISMLYIDWNDRIVIKNYPDMIVDGCGCR